MDSRESGWNWMAMNETKWFRIQLVSKYRRSQFQRNERVLNHIYFSVFVFSLLLFSLVRSEVSTAHPKHKLWLKLTWSVTERFACYRFVLLESIESENSSGNSWTEFIHLKIMSQCWWIQVAVVNTFKQCLHILIKIIRPNSKENEVTIICSILLLRFAHLNATKGKFEFEFEQMRSFAYDF